MPNQPTVWITGASSGIGEALALAYAKQHANLILSARNLEQLESVAKQCRTGRNHVLVQPLDLSDVEQIPAVVDAVRTQVVKVDVLINNGGFSQRSSIIETPIEIDRKIFEVNYFGTIALTKAVLPWMIETGGGNISVVSSISGKFGFHLRASYAATKHAVIGYFESLGLEHYHDNIKTTIICPGRIRTNISLHALKADGSVTGQMDRGLAQGMDVHVCARQIIKAIQKNKREVLIGKKELLLVYIHKYWPWLFWRIAPNIDPN